MVLLSNFDGMHQLWDLFSKEIPPSLSSCWVQRQFKFYLALSSWGCCLPLDRFSKN